MRQIDAIYREGKTESLEPLCVAEGSLVKVMVLKSNKAGGDIQRRLVKQLRGKFEGSLSSSKAFSQQKAEAKAIER